MDNILPCPISSVGTILLSAGCSNGLPHINGEKNGKATSPVQLHRDTKSTDNISGTPTCPNLELLRGRDMVKTVLLEEMDVMECLEFKVQ
jgi:hypothetical protein